MRPPKHGATTQQHGVLAYLICFREPIGRGARGQARHYLGSAEDLPVRLQLHRDGHGARLLEVLAERGIGWDLVATWPGGRATEKQLKRRHEGPRLCPRCNPARKPLPGEIRYPAAGPGLAGTQGSGPPANRGGRHDPAGPQGQEEKMFGRRARAERRAQAEADRLFAIADELERQTGERPNYQREITAERAARIREQIGEDLVHDARTPSQSPAREPELQGAELDAEIDRLAHVYPDAASAKTDGPDYLYEAPVARDGGHAVVPDVVAEPGTERAPSWRSEVDAPGSLYGVPERSDWRDQVIDAARQPWQPGPVQSGNPVTLRPCAAPEPGADIEPGGL